jgi:hypothetical protein
MIRRTEKRPRRRRRQDRPLNAGLTSLIAACRGLFVDEDETVKDVHGGYHERR